MPITKETKSFVLKCEREVIKDAGTPYLDLITCYEESNPSNLFIVIRDGSVEKLDLSLLEGAREEETE